MSAPTKSWDLDPLPTHVVKELLPQLLPYITDMCNASLSQGTIPVSQRHVIVTPRRVSQRNVIVTPRRVSQRHVIFTPRRKKSGLDPADMKNYR